MLTVKECADVNSPVFCEGRLFQCAIREGLVTAGLDSNRSSSDSPSWSTGGSGGARTP